MFKKKHSKEARRKMSLAKKGIKRKPFSKEWKAKLGDSHRGYKHLESTKKKISEAHKDNRNPFYNKHHSVKTKEKWSKMRTKENHPNWKGKKLQKGYVYIYKPIHPSANEKGYVKRANLVMERHLGRYLKKREIVHHKGTKFPIHSIKNRQDDRIKNLELFANSSKHMKYHNYKRNKFGQFTSKLMTL